MEVLKSFFYLLNGEYFNSVKNAVYAVLYGICFSILLTKRKLIIASTSSAFRKKKLLQIATGISAFAPTVIFLVNEHIACLAGASFNTRALRNQTIAPGDDLSDNAVTRNCDAHSTGSLPMLWSVMFVTVGKILTYRKSQVTLSRLATIQLPLLDILDGILSLMLVITGVVMFK